MEKDEGRNEDFNISSSTGTTVLELAKMIWEKINPEKPFRFTSDPPFDYDVEKRIPSVEKAKKVLTEKIDDLHKLAKALLVYETLTGDEIRDLILKNIQPTKLSKKEEEDADDKASSAIDSIGLKPKPAL